MTDLSATKPGKTNNDQENTAKKPVIDVRAEKTKALRNKVSGVGIKVSAIPSKQHDAMQDTDQNFTAFDHDEEPVLMLKPVNAQAPLAKQNTGFKVLKAAIAVFSLVWATFCISYAFTVGVSFTPVDLGAVLAAMFAPPALLWMILSTFGRGDEVHQYASALRSELQTLIFPSDETSAIINKDVERLCRQAAEVSAASKAVLKSLQRARQGLRMEIRDFSGVSKKAEFHIDRLAESLNDKTGKLLSLTDEIEQRTSNIDERVQAGAEAWDQATLTILERSGEMEAAVGRGAEKLLEAAEKAGDKTKDIEDHLNNSFDNLNASVDEVAQKLKGLSTEFDGHTDGLSDVADNVSEEVERLVGMIQDQIADLEAAADRTVETMTASTESMQHHKALLDQGAESVAEQSEKITQSITVSVETLNDGVDSVMQKTEGLEERIEQKTSALHDVVKGITKEADYIDEAGTHAANKLGEALAVAVSGAESISSAVRRAVESLEESTQAAKDQADDLITRTKQHVDDLNAAGEGNVEHIKEIVSLLESNREQIETVAANAKTHVEELAIAVDQQSEKVNLSALSLTERVQQVQSALSDPLKDIQNAISEADGRHEMIEDVLRRRVSDLNEASEKATTSAEHIREVLRGQAQEISTLSGQVSGHSRTINEQMILQKDTLAAQVKDSLNMVEVVSDALDQKSKTLSEVSKVAANDIEALKGQIETRCEEITMFTGNALERLVNVDDSLDDKITLLKEHADSAAQSVETVREALESTATEIEPVYLKAIDQAESAQERFNKLKIGFETTSESNLVRLQQIGVIFDERLQNLKEGSLEASNLLRESSDHLHERVSDIETASKSAHNKMRDITSALDDQSSDIHLITDQALLKIEAIQKSINEQFHELSASVGQAIAQIQDAGGEFTKHAELVHNEAEKAAEGFDAAGAKAIENTHKLGEAADTTVGNTELLVSRVQREAEGLLEQANESLFELKKTGDTFAIRSREMAEQMKASLQTSEAYGKELKAQSSMVADSSALSADRMGKVVSELNATINDIGEAAHKATIKVEKSREELANESGRLLSVSTAALESAKDAALTFSKQSESLFKASQDASEFAKEIQKSGMRAQREAFMGSAKFIIESLHSMSVDLTRMLEGDVSEKTWKAFQKGDVSAFTRKMSEISGNLPLDKARDKFAKDTEFRTYVQRYLRQFEEMYEQAMQNDHGSILSSTLGSSEVGKLYEFLCQVAGKTSKLSQATLKAA